MSLYMWHRQYSRDESFKLIYSNEYVSYHQKYDNDNDVDDVNDDDIDEKVAIKEKC